jgi:hypothetical protein
MQLVATTALTIAVTAGAQTGGTAGAASAVAPPLAAAATPVQNPKPKVSDSRAKATAKSRTNPTVCAHLPPDDRAGCVAKAKPSKTAPALTTSASGAGGGGGSVPKP